MRDEEKILNSLDKLQRDIDAIKQEIKSQEINQNGDESTFKTVVKPVNTSKNIKDVGSSRLEGDIDTI
jgi:hypothetical protein